MPSPSRCPSLAPAPNRAPALPPLLLLLTFQSAPRARALLVVLDVRLDSSSSHSQDLCFALLARRRQRFPAAGAPGAACAQPPRVRVRVRGGTEAGLFFRFSLFAYIIASLPPRPPPSRCRCSWSCSSSWSYSCSCSRRTSQARPRGRLHWYDELGASTWPTLSRYPARVEPELNLNLQLQLNLKLAPCSLSQTPHPPACLQPASCNMYASSNVPPFLPFLRPGRWPWALPRLTLALLLLVLVVLELSPGASWSWSRDFVVLFL
ncbi:hypothetical protein GALMADRAFT_916519 [Galerina marginata CBS 339.88]|uniref:Uncharacterized protein n=1 Tax=Galerina marginata (strain CBS 339.88) TaxID=685588 RepID=A0A067SHU5_GALM3|nr:hypothetical protein GALMADRAFT_916519 [Galerina marginata CBS 339.88]